MECRSELLEKVYFVPNEQSLSAKSLAGVRIFSVAGLLIRLTGRGNGVFERIGIFSISVPSRSDLDFLRVARNRVETEYEEFDGDGYTIRLV
jgi:hypothetical protein